MTTWEENLLDQLNKSIAEKSALQQGLRELEVENTRLRKRNADLEDSLRYALLHSSN